jgi:hypothetical protein
MNTTLKSIIITFLPDDDQAKPEIKKNIPNDLVSKITEPSDGKIELSVEDANFAKVANSVKQIRRASCCAIVPGVGVVKISDRSL